MSSITAFLALHSKQQEQHIVVQHKNIFTFGKYKGKTYDEVFELDKSYVVFCLEQDPKYYRKIQEYYKKLIEALDKSQ
jgi:hypothetical protein